MLVSLDGTVPVVVVVAAVEVVVPIDTEVLKVSILVTDNIKM